MDEGPRRARSHSQQQVARRQWRRLFFGASEWKCGPKAARQSEVPSRPVAEGRGRISDLGGVGSLWGARRGRSMLGDTRRGSGGFYRARAALGGYGKNRSESSVDGRKRFSTAGTAIVGGEGGS